MPVSLMPAILEGKGVRTDDSYMETLYPKSHLGWSELRGIRTDDWKVIVAPKSELYQIRIFRSREARGGLSLSLPS